MNQETTAPPLSAKKRTRKTLIFTSVFLLVLMAGIFLAPAVISSLAYARGHQAYLQADCDTAIQEFDRALRNAGPIGAAQTSARSSREKETCSTFQQAVEAEEEDSKAALMAYIGFYNQYPDTPLAPAAQQKIDKLFDNNNAAALASLDTCGQIDFLRARTWKTKTPTEEFWPAFYTGCIQRCETAGLSEEAHTWYLALLTEFPEHTLSKQAVSGLLEQPGSATCAQLEAMRAEPAIETNFPELAPGLYVQCGEQYETENKPAAALDLYQSFLANYPNHPLTDQVISALLKNESACANLPDFEGDGSRPPAPFLPELFAACGKLMDERGEAEQAYQVYTKLLTQYPEYEPAAPVETALLSNPTSCEQRDELVNSSIANRPDFLARLHINCASSLRSSGKFEEAIALYQWVLDEKPDSPAAAEAGISIAQAHCEWGRSLIAEKEFSQAMEHYLTAKSLTKDETVTQMADEGYEEALWALATDKTGEGKQVLEETYALACDGRSATSPAAGLAKEEGKKGLICPTKSEYEIKLPSDIAAQDPAHFQYAIQIESGGTAYDTCTYGQRYYDPKNPFAYKNYHYLIRRKVWVKVTIRTTETGGTIAQREFTEYPEKCPTSYDFKETTEYLIAPWPQTEEIIAWLRNWLK